MPVVLLFDLSHVQSRLHVLLTSLIFLSPLSLLLLFCYLLLLHYLVNVVVVKGLSECWSMYNVGDSRVSTILLCSCFICMSCRCCRPCGLCMPPLAPPARGPMWRSACLLSMWSSPPFLSESSWVFLKH